MAENTAFFSIKVDGADKLEANLTRLTKRGNELKSTKQGLTKELKALDKASKTYTTDSTSLNNSLAKTNIALKENNTELNKNQKEYIESSNAIKASTGSLVEMRAQLKKSTALYDKLSASQRNNLEIGGKHKKRIQELSASLKDMEGATGRAQRNVGNYGSGLKGFAQKVGGSFKNMAASVGGALAGLFAFQKAIQLFKNALNTVKNFEEQMAKVKAITGSTAEEFLLLEKSAKDLGSTTQFTATEVGKLQEEFAKLGFNTDEILDASEATLELALATGSDLAQSAKVAAATINGFGLKAKDTQKIVDIMAKSFTNSALDIRKFEVAMASVAPVASAVGFTIEQTTASLGTLTDAGFDASTSGTALRNILLDVQKKGLTVSGAFKDIRESIDPAKKALDLFGKRGAAVGLTLAKSEKQTNAFAVSLTNAGGSAASMSKIVGDTLEGDIKRLSSAWEGLILKTTGTDLFRNLTKSAVGLVSAISDLTTNTHEESEALENQRVAVNVLVGQITDLNVGTDERKKLIEELNRISPKFLDGLDKENLSHKAIAGRLTEINEQLVNQIILKRESEKIDAQAQIIATVTKDKLKAEGIIRKQFVKDSEALLRAEKIIKKQVDERTGVAKKRAEALLASTQKQVNILNDSSISQIEKARKINDIQNKGRTERSLFDDEDVSKQFAVLDNANEKLKIEKNIGDVIQASADELKKSLLGSQRTEKAKEVLNIVKETNLETKKNSELTEEEDENIKKRNKATKKLQEETRKEKLSNSILEIQDKQTAEDRKLEIERAEAIKSIELSGATAEARRLAEQEVNKKFDLKEANLLLARTETKKADDLVVAEKLEADNLTALEKEETQKAKLKSIAVDLARKGAEELVGIAKNKVEKEKTQEIEALQSKLDEGIISQTEFDKKKLEIEKKAFNKNKALQIANVGIALATQIANIQANAAANPANAVTAGIAGLTQAATLTAIAVGTSAVTAGIIASKKFARGGVLEGASHANGGIPFTINGRQGFEAEGGETLINKESSRRFAPLLSQINQAGGGVSLSSPNSSNLSKFRDGGNLTGSDISLDNNGIKEDIISGVISAIGSIKVVNVSEETTNQSNRVREIENINTF